MEMLKPGRPLLVPPVAMTARAPVPQIRDHAPQHDDVGFGVRLSQDNRVWLESALFSLIVNMVLMIIGGFIFCQQQTSDILEVMVAQSEELQPVEMIEVPIAAPEVDIKQNLVAGSITDAATDIDLKQTTLAGAKAEALTENFAIDGLAAGENRMRGSGDRGAGNGIGDLLGGAFGDRLTSAGAKTGDVQVSLIWNNRNDLDLHVIPPSGQEISFMRPRSRCNGRLDVDMNAGLLTSEEPVENVFWPTGKAPNGKYRVLVQYYSRRDATTQDGSFQVAVKVNGEVLTFQGRVDERETVEVTTFIKTSSGRPATRTPSKTPAKTTASSKTSL
ncbi:MAG: hypothetical protein JNM18_16540 [Planctomycetaceae bacterium]|nr:hypothetical protein [Planctomycetaceae bacterium]